MLYNEGRRSGIDSSTSTEMVVCPAPNSSFVFTGCEDNVCAAESGDRIGYVVDNSLATTVAGLGQVSCAADFVERAPRASCSFTDLANPENIFSFSGCVCRAGTRLVGSACVPCAAGTFATGSACEGCATGRVDDDEDAATECVPCASGRLVNTSGASAICSGICPTGTTTPPGSTSAAECHQCLPGHFVQESDSGTTCVSCYDHVSRTTSETPECSAFGCIDPWATNFNHTARITDDTCRYDCGQMLARVEAGEIDICDGQQSSWIENGTEWALRRDSMDANSVNMCLHRLNACRASLLVPPITTNRVGVRLPLIEVPDLAIRVLQSFKLAADFNNDGIADIFIYGGQVKPGTFCHLFRTAAACTRRSATGHGSWWGTRRGMRPRAISIQTGMWISRSLRGGVDRRAKVSCACFWGMDRAALPRASGSIPTGHLSN